MVQGALCKKLSAGVPGLKNIIFPFRREIARGMVI